MIRSMDLCNPWIENERLFLFTALVNGGSINPRKSINSWGMYTNANGIGEYVQSWHLLKQNVRLVGRYVHWPTIQGIIYFKQVDKIVIRY